MEKISCFLLFLEYPYIESYPNDLYFFFDFGNDFCVLFIESPIKSVTSFNPIKLVPATNTVLTKPVVELKLDNWFQIPFCYMFYFMFFPLYVDI